MKKQFMILFGFILLAVAAYFVVPHSAKDAALPAQAHYPYANAQRIQAELTGPTYHGLSYRETKASMESSVANHQKVDHRMPANTQPEPAKESK